jgi:hypothetical protein
MSEKQTQGLNWISKQSITTKVFATIFIPLTLAGLLAVLIGMAGIVFGFGLTRTDWLALILMIPILVVLVPSLIVYLFAQAKNISRTDPGRRNALNGICLCLLAGALYLFLFSVFAWSGFGFLAGNGLSGFLAGIFLSVSGLILAVYNFNPND